jgi:hypothetical protein
MFALCLAGCIDHLLQGAADGGASESGAADSAGDPDDEGCVGSTLGPSDGVPIDLAESLGHVAANAPVAFFGHSIAASGAPPSSVVAQAGWTLGSEDGGGEGTYVLDRSAWVAGVVRAPIIESDASHGAVYVMAAGRTTRADAPGEAAWIVADGERSHQSELWLFDSLPEMQVELEDRDAHIAVGQGEDRSLEASPGDLDGDGLDDLVVQDLWSGTQTAFYLAPFVGSLVLEDADAWVPQAWIDADVGRELARGAFADLDEDGYLDLAFPWTYLSNRTGDIHVKRGPLLGTGEPGLPEGAFLAEAGADDLCSCPTGRAFGTLLVAAGDVTGDGRPDITAPLDSDEDGEPNSMALVVLDHLPAGSESLADQEIRLHGAAADEDNQARRRLQSGGGGDFDGDGWGDLVAYQGYAGLADGDVHRSYVVLGPLDGPVDLPTESCVIDLPFTAGGDPDHGTLALAVPDFDADGKDEVVVNTIDEISPGKLWLFSGRADW